MKKSLIAASVTLALLPWASQASDVFTLGEIDVHAPARNMLSSARVNQATLQLNDATTLDDLGRFVPGVYMHRIGGRNDRNLMVRGFDAHSVPLLVDGIPVYVPYDGANDMSRYTTFEYTTINVSKGTGSVLYGPNALGGAVNLVTAKPTKPFEAKVGLGLKTGRSSHTLGEEGFVNLGTKQDLWYGMIDLSYVNDEGMQAPHGFHGSEKVPMTNKSLVNSKHMDYKGTIKLGLTPNMTDEYSLVITHQHGDKQQPLSTNYDWNDKGKKFLRSPRFWRWPKWDKTNVYLLTHTELNEANQLYVDGKVFYSRFDNDMESWDAPNDKTAQKPVFKSPADYAPIFDMPRSEFSTYRDYSLGAGLEVGATLAKAHAVKGSFFWVDDIHRDQKTKYGKTTTVNPQIKDQDRTLTFAAEDTYTVNDKLTLIGGLAYSTRDPKKNAVLPRKQRPPRKVCN